MREVKKKKKGRVLITLGILCIIAALGLAAFNFYTDYSSGKKANEITEAIKIDKNRGGGIIDPNVEMPTIEVNQGRYLGILDIPSVDIHLPVASKWSYDILAICPGRYTGSVYKDNMVIAGHNYRTHFGRLSGLGVGSNVTFTDAYGNVFEYEVGTIEIVDPFDVEHMTESDWDLTIFTCTLGGRTRLTIRCKRKSEHDFVIPDEVAEKEGLNEEKDDAVMKKDAKK